MYSYFTSFTLDSNLLFQIPNARALLTVEFESEPTGKTIAYPVLTSSDEVYQIK